MNAGKIKNILIMAAVNVCAIIIIVLSILVTNKHDSNDATSQESTQLHVTEETNNAIVSTETTTPTTETKPASMKEQTTNTTPVVVPTKTEQPTTKPVTSNKTTTRNVNTTDSKTQMSDYVNEVIAGTESKRCEWIDTEGNEGIAFHLYSLLRTEVEIHNETYITIHKPTASYFWNKEEREGILIPREGDAYILLTGYTPYETIVNYLQTSSRVKCEVSVINEAHFTPPTNVTFTEIVK